MPRVVLLSLPVKLDHNYEAHPQSLVQRHKVQEVTWPRDSLKNIWKEYLIQDRVYCECQWCPCSSEISRFYMHIYLCLYPAVPAAAQSRTECNWNTGAGIIVHLLQFGNTLLCTFWTWVIWCIWICNFYISSDVVATLPCWIFSWHAT